MERFLGFFPLVDRTAAGLEELITETLQPYQLENKMIAQTYDGAAVMSGATGGVQARMKETFPHAHFVHCYAHQLNLIMQKACSSVTAVRVFFANITAFATFFSKSTKRTAVLDEVCGRRIPAAGQTRWNFKSRTVHTVFENKDTLKRCFEKIQNDPSWDSVSIQQAHGLSAMLEDADFLFFLSFFHSALYHVDILYNKLQKRTTDPIATKTSVDNFSRSITGLKDTLATNDAQPDPNAQPDADAQIDTDAREPDANSAAVVRPRRGQPDARDPNANAAAAVRTRRGPPRDNVPIAKKCCDIMIEQAHVRFEKAQHLVAFELIDTAKFAQYKTSFPQKQLDTAKEYFPMLDKEKIKASWWQCTVVPSLRGYILQWHF